MDSTTAQPPSRLSPQQRLALLQEDLPLLGKPFVLTGNPRAIQAQTRHVALMLMDTAADRASRAAAFMEELVDQLVHTQVTGPVACGRGCTHCCTTFVSATVPEILRLARSVRATALRSAHVLDAAGRAKAIPQHLRETRRIVCPILEQHACSEYLVRPMVCRTLLSTSLETCIQILVEDRPAPMPHAGNSALIRTVTVIIMKAALILAGLSDRHYELTQGLAVALSEPDAERRWLAGEAVFANVPMDAADTGGPSPLMGLVNVLVDTVRPTL